ncbi:MAG: glycosyltransferase [Rikenellaceae bacterium]
MPFVARESFCLSIVEFMELGKVVVSTNNGAQPEFIDDRYTLYKEVM